MLLRVFASKRLFYDSLSKYTAQIIVKTGNILKTKLECSSLAGSNTGTNMTIKPALNRVTDNDFQLEALPHTVLD